MWIEPPAMTSAPEPTEPRTVTSPSGKNTDCPERTGVSSRSELGSLRAAAAAGLLGEAESTASTVAARPPFNRGGGGRQSTPLNSQHPILSYARFFFEKKKTTTH